MPALDFIKEDSEKVIAIPKQHKREVTDILIMSDEEHKAMEVHREFVRAKPLNKGRVMTFDCYNTRVKRGERVFCSKGHSLNINSNDGSAFIKQILKGAFLSPCQECPDFEGD